MILKYPIFYILFYFFCIHNIVANLRDYYLCLYEIYLSFFFFLFLSCNTNVEKQSDLNIYRFENILFNSNYENIEKNRNIWEGEIGQFASTYYSFLSVENDIDLIESDLLSFVENSDMREVYDSIKGLSLAPMGSYELEMSKAFKNFTNLFSSI